MEKTRPVLAKRLTAALWLAIIMLAGINLKIRLSTFTPRYDSADETGYFRTESAYQYRYARMIAEGKTVPEVDRDAQWPEGVRPRRELTPLMEEATGLGFRLVRAVAGMADFRWFVILWVAMFSSLAVPGFFLLARRLSGSTALALAAAAVYGLSWASQSNLVATYVFESFAQPLMFASLAALAAALDDEERQRAIGFAGVAALFMALSLWSWHLARFYWATIVAALFWLAWTRRKDEDALTRIAETLGAMWALLFAAGLAIPCLRESGFSFSPPMIGAAALALWLRFPEKRRWIAAITAVTLAYAAWRSRDSSVYGHVYSYLWAKVRFGFVRPADPSRLPSEARSIWNGPADSPSLGFLFFSLIPLAGLAIPRIASLFKREPPPQRLSGTLVDGLFLLYTAGAALALRLMQLFVFFLLLACVRLPSHRAKSIWLAVAFAVIAGLEGLKALAPASRLNPFIRVAAMLPEDDRHPATTFRDELAVIRWLKANAAGQPVLSDISFSANFLTYAGTPVIVHPKFEAPGIRAKVGEYLKALFSSEEDFYAYCRKYGAKVFVLTVYDLLDETPDGPRYTSGSMRLTKDTAAVLLHFKPDALKHFRLVYQNDDFRIFAVGQPPGKPAPAPPVYDLAQYAPRAEPDGSLSLDVAGVLSRIKESRQKLFLARVLLRGRMPEAALGYYEGAFAAWPPDPASKAEYERLRKGLEGAR